MWRKKWPSYNLPMREAGVVGACLAASLVLVACGPNHHVDPSAGGAEAGGAAGTGQGGKADAGEAGTSTSGAGGVNGGASAGGGAGSSGGCTLPELPAGGAPDAVGTDLGALQVDSVAVWKGDAKGAYSIIHDDLCDYTIDSLFTIAEPELTKRDLRAGFGAIVQRCVERKLWAKVALLRDHHHEIVNHTWDHKDIVEEASAAPLSVEIDQATQVLDQNLVDQHTSFFIFPYDSFNDAAVEHLGSLGYLGARAGKKGVNAADFPDGLRVMFDVYGGENSIYDGQGDILKIYVDLAVSQGGWAVREFHGISDSTFWSLQIDTYREHLDYIKSLQDAGELWVDAPSAILRYRFSRQYCGVPKADGFRVSFAAPDCDCARYAAPLSVIVTSATDAPSAVATQDGSMLATRKVGPKRFAIDMNPLGGPVAIGGGS